MSNEIFFKNLKRKSFKCNFQIRNYGSKNKNTFSKQFKYIDEKITQYYFSSSKYDRLPNSFRNISANKRRWNSKGLCDLSKREQRWLAYANPAADVADLMRIWVVYMWGEGWGPLIDLHCTRRLLNVQFSIPTRFFFPDTLQEFHNKAREIIR